VRMVLGRLLCDFRFLDIDPHWPRGAGTPRSSTNGRQPLFPRRAKKGAAKESPNCHIRGRRNAQSAALLKPDASERPTTARTDATRGRAAPSHGGEYVGSRGHECNFGSPRAGGSCVDGARGKALRYPAHHRGLGDNHRERKEGACGRSLWALNVITGTAFTPGGFAPSWLPEKPGPSNPTRDLPSRYTTNELRPKHLAHGRPLYWHPTPPSEQKERTRVHRAAKHKRLFI
jgi:hypothetical protein